MADKMSNKDQLNKQAEKAFKPAERRDTASKQITDAEHATSATKTKNSRALRLAKEATDTTDVKHSASRKPIRVKRLKRS